MDPIRLASAAANVADEIIEFRRDLHRHPELSEHEERTAARVAERLAQAGIPVRSGVAGHGLLAQIGTGEPCVGLRADMDALPITEQTGLPWTSETPGVMHACGHDFHTSWLLGAGLILQQLGVAGGSVKLLFQPAEEGLHGAEDMIADGCLSDPPLRAIVGAHVAPEFSTGIIGLRPGPNLSAADRFTITLTGRGTHGSSPQRGIDPIPAAAELISALQTIITRRLSPLHNAVLSVCQVHAGTAFNIIPAQAELSGTVRTLIAEDQNLIEQALIEMAERVAAVHGCSAQINYFRGVPATITDPAVTETVRLAAEQVLDPGQVIAVTQPSMGAEDFAFYLQTVPGAVLHVGCSGPASPQESRSLHCPGFVGDEACLLPAMKTLAAAALALLEE